MWTVFSICILYFFKDLYFYNKVLLLICITHVYSCLFMFTHLYSFFTHDYSCLLMFIHVYSCLSMFTHFYPFLLMFTHVYSCLSMFTHVYPCLLMFTHVYPCLLMFTHVYSLILVLLFKDKGLWEIQQPYSIIYGWLLIRLCTMRDKFVETDSYKQCACFSQSNCWPFLFIPVWHLQNVLYSSSTVTSCLHSICV